ncbi:MAG TPA: hypothetical protein VI893_00760 [Thermoplasmata archaeon]|nr:hypothetical protein [Thermoplasmata archaeon]
MNNVLTQLTTVSASNSAGQTHSYKAEYDPALSKFRVWRDGGTPKITYTDTASPLKMGAFVSFRTNSASVNFDYLYVNSSMSNPRSNDTDADGLYDWNDLSGWNPVNGTWEWRDGVYQQRSASSAANTNSYAAVSQSGETTYEWRQKMTAATGWAGLHIFSDNGAAGNRGNSYLVALKANAAPTSDKIEVCKTTANALSCKKGINVNELGTGVWNKLKVVYTPSNYSVNVWRNGSWLDKWTDTAAAALQSGSAVSLRANNTNAHFDDFYVNASGANKATWTEWSGWGERPSGAKLAAEDTDGDGLVDGREVAGWPVSIWISGIRTNMTVTASPLLPNTDGPTETWDDKTEYDRGTDPRDPDSDRDFTLDSSDSTPMGVADTDQDGAPDDIENGTGWQIIGCYGYFNCFDYWENSDWGPKDTDGDGIWDGEEWRLRYDARKKDTDNDGWLDEGNFWVTVEVLNFTEYLDASWSGNAAMNLMFQYPAVAMDWRIPGKGKYWSMKEGDQIYLNGAHPRMEFPSDSRWADRNLTIISRDLAYPYGVPELGAGLGSAKYQLPVVEGVTTPVIHIGGNASGQSGAWVGLRVTANKSRDPYPLYENTDKDLDGLTDSIEYRYRLSPLVRDILLEVDWHQNSVNSFDRTSWWLDTRAKTRITDPFMSNGIYLHIDDGVLGGGNGFNIAPYPKGKRTSGPDNDFWDYKWGNDWDDGDGIPEPGIDNLNGNFNKSRLNIFHYMILGPSLIEYDPINKPGEYADGVGDWRADDSYLSHLVPKQGIRPGAGVFIHELGHNLGLKHYGPNWDGPGCYRRCPDYVSVMSYLYTADPTVWPAAWGDSPNYGPLPAHAWEDWLKIVLEEISKTSTKQEGF